MRVDLREWHHIVYYHLNVFQITSIIKTSGTTKDYINTLLLAQPLKDRIAFHLCWQYEIIYFYQFYFKFFQFLSLLFIIWNDLSNKY